MSGYTAKRISDLENDVSGDGAIIKTNIAGWLKKTYPNGQIEATTTLDYNLFNFTEDVDSLSWKISETIPDGIFNNYPSVEAQCIDISSGTAKKNSIMVARSSLPGLTTTGQFCIQPVEVVWGSQGYTIPTTVQICWIAKGD